VSAALYGACPVEPSVNRNGQKVFRGRKVSVVLHKNGDFFVYPFFIGWDEEVTAFLSSWVPGGSPHVEAIMRGLQEHGKKEIAFHTPGVPKNYKIRIKGVGTFKTDRTPYPDGTTEYEMDLGFEKRLSSIERNLEKFTNAMGQFAVAMSQHLALIEEIRSLIKLQHESAEETRILVEALRKAVDKLSKG